MSLADGDKLISQSSEKIQGAAAGEKLEVDQGLTEDGLYDYVYQSLGALVKSSATKISKHTTKLLVKVKINRRQESVNFKSVVDVSEQSNDKGDATDEFRHIPSKHVTKKQNKPTPITKKNSFLKLKNLATRRRSSEQDKSAASTKLDRKVIKRNNSDIIDDAKKVKLMHSDSVSLKSVEDDFEEPEKLFSKSAFTKFLKQSVKKRTNNTFEDGRVVPEDHMDVADVELTVEEARSDLTSNINNQDIDNFGEDLLAKASSEKSANAIQINAGEDVQVTQDEVYLNQTTRFQKFQASLRKIRSSKGKNDRNISFSSRMVRKLSLDQDMDATAKARNESVRPFEHRRSEVMTSLAKGKLKSKLQDSNVRSDKDLDLKHLQKRHDNNPLVKINNFLNMKSVPTRKINSENDKSAWNANVDQKKIMRNINDLSEDEKNVKSINLRADKELAMMYGERLTISSARDLKNGNPNGAKFGATLRRTVKIKPTVSQSVRNSRFFLDQPIISESPSNTVSRSASSEAAQNRTNMGQEHSTRLNSKENMVSIVPSGANGTHFTELPTDFLNSEEDKAIEIESQTLEPQIIQQKYRVARDYGFSKPNSFRKRLAQLDLEHADDNMSLTSAETVEYPLDDNKSQRGMSLTGGADVEHTMPESVMKRYILTKVKDPQPPSKNSHKPRTMELGKKEIIKNQRKGRVRVAVGFQLIEEYDFQAKYILFYFLLPLSIMVARPLVQWIFFCLSVVFPLTFGRDPSVPLDIFFGYTTDYKLPFYLRWFVPEDYHNILNMRIEFGNYTMRLGALIGGIQAARTVYRLFFLMRPKVLVVRRRTSWVNPPKKYKFVFRFTDADDHDDEAIDFDDHDHH